MQTSTIRGALTRLIIDSRILLAAFKHFGIPGNTDPDRWIRSRSHSSQNLRFQFVTTCPRFRTFHAAIAFLAHEICCDYDKGLDHAVFSGLTDLNQTSHPLLVLVLVHPNAYTSTSIKHLHIYLFAHRILSLQPRTEIAIAIMSFARCAAILGLVASTLALPQPLGLSKRQMLSDFSDSKSCILTCNDCTRNEILITIPQSRSSTTPSPSNTSRQPSTAKAWPSSPPPTSSPPACQQTPTRA